MLAVTALVAGVAAVLVFVALLGGDDTPPPAERAAPTDAAAPADEPAEPADEPAARRALSAPATVRAFYRRAAADDFAGAWRLAGPGMRDAFGGSFERFQSDLSSLQRIEFERVQVVERAGGAVTVEISSVATHTDRVDRCTGTLRTVRSDGGRWLVEPAGVQCTSG